MPVTSRGSFANSSQRPAIKALVFDAYGTLFDVHSVLALCNERFPGRGQELSVLWRGKQLEYAWLLSLMGRYEDFWSVTARALVFACRSLQLPLDDSTRTRLMEAYLRLDPFPDVASGLRAFSALPLAILSNGSPRMLDAVVQNAGLAKVFRHVLSVNAVMVYKPDRRVYALAPAALGVETRSIGFVSSNSFDVQGAAAFGFFTCWINRGGVVAEELGPEPDLTVQSLRALVDALQSV